MPVRAKRLTKRRPNPAPLTPGAWAANEDRASYADEEGNLLATFRCDPETAEIVLEMAQMAGSASPRCRYRVRRAMRSSHFPHRLQ